jgi:hypothetical protein
MIVGASRVYARESHDRISLSAAEVDSIRTSPAGTRPRRIRDRLGEAPPTR